MFKAIRLAIRYQHVLPLAIDLIKETEISVRDDGTITKEERSKLLKRFWALVKALQDPQKEKFILEKVKAKK
tara:strand:+ start:490 stop:705 length:216 start_codon:yes stop_codon:yes gene_type:complete